MIPRLVLACALLAALPAWGQPKPPVDVPADNPEMTRLFDEDQAVRLVKPIHWDKVRPADAARRSRTKALLDAGLLRTGGDYLHAAFVFQHGDQPADFLIAHALAIAAAAKGEADAPWIAAATLDRYLQNIGKPQVFGTQYRMPDSGVTQEPYDRTILSDGVRAVLRVPSLKQQQEDLAGWATQFQATKP